MKISLYEKSLADCVSYCAKRFVLLFAKLAGLKGFCLFLGTALLCCHVIHEDVWLTIAVTVICSASGLRVFDAVQKARSLCGVMEMNNEWNNSKWNAQNNGSCLAAGALPELALPGSGAERKARKAAVSVSRKAGRAARERGVARMRQLVQEAAEEL